MEAVAETEVITGSGCLVAWGAMVWFSGSHVTPSTAPPPPPPPPLGRSSSEMAIHGTGPITIIQRVPSASGYVVVQTQDTVCDTLPAAESSKPTQDSGAPSTGSTSYPCRPALPPKQSMRHTGSLCLTKEGYLTSPLSPSVPKEKEVKSIPAPKVCPGASHRVRLGARQWHGRVRHCRRLPDRPGPGHQLPAALHLLDSQLQLRKRADEVIPADPDPEEEVPVPRPPAPF